MLIQVTNTRQGTDRSLNTAHKVIHAKLDRDNEYEAFSDLSLAEQRKFLAIRAQETRVWERWD